MNFDRVKIHKITRLTYRETFLRLAELGVYPEAFATEIAGSAGLRNILVHDYNDADRRIVYGAIRKGMEQYRQYVEYVRAFLDDLPKEPSADA